MQFKLSKQHFHFLSMLIVGVVLSSISFESLAAAGGGGGLPYEGWLESIRQSITGPVAFATAIIGIVGAGAALIFAGSEMNGFLKTIIYIVLVMAFLVGAQNIMSGLFNTSATIPTPVINTVI